MRREMNPGRALAALRKTKSGGKAPSCLCSECPKCKNREYIRNYRARLKAEALAKASLKEAKRLAADQSRMERKTRTNLTKG